MITISMNYDTGWLDNLKKYGFKPSQGFRNFIQHLVRCARGKNFTYVSIATLARLTGLHPRTIEKFIQQAKNIGLIVEGFKEELQRWGYFFLAHPAIVAWREAKKMWRNLKQNRGNNNAGTTESETAGTGEEVGAYYPDSAATSGEFDQRGQNVDDLVRASGRPNDPTTDDAETRNAITYNKIHSNIAILSGQEKRQKIGDSPSLLDIGRMDTDFSPLTPMVVEAADAAGERDGLTQTVTASSDAGGSQDADSRCHFGRMERENGRDMSIFPIGRERTDDRKRDGGAVGRGIADPIQAKASALWPQAIEILKKIVPEGDLALWLEPLKAEKKDGRFVLYCPDPYFTAYVERHFLGAIKVAFQQLGIADFSEQDLLVEDRLAPVIAQQQIQKEKQEEDWRKLNSLPYNEQFKVLVAAYPRKTSGEWFAWQTFCHLRRKGELPDMATLLRLINQQTSSLDWQRDNWRYVPGLNKWLRNKPWWNSGDKAEESAARRSTSSIHCMS